VATGAALLGFALLSPTYIRFRVGVFDTHRIEPLEISQAFTENTVCPDAMIVRLDCIPILFFPFVAPTPS